MTKKERIKDIYSWALFFRKKKKKILVAILKKNLSRKKTQLGKELHQTLLKNPWKMNLNPESMKLTKM